MPIDEQSHNRHLDHRAYGWMIALGSIAVFGAMGLHPSAGGPPLEMVQTIIRQGAFNQTVHGALMVLYVILAVGFLGLCHYLGRHRILVQLGYAAYVTSIVAAISAAVSAGFVMRSLAQGYATAGADKVDLITTAFRVAGGFNYAWGRIWMVALAAAILLWSIALLRQSSKGARALGIAGIVLGGGSLIGLIGGMIGLSVYAVLAMIAGQTLWSVGVGILLIRDRP